MKLIIASVMACLSIYYLSCGNKNDESETLNNLLFPEFNIGEPIDCGKVILANGINPDLPVMDPYEIDNAEFDGDTLKLKVSYSGGCKQHEFCLIAWNYFLESYPVQAQLLLTHNSNDDYCDAIIKSDLNIDMSTLKQKYIEQYGNTEDHFIVRIKINSEEEINLAYKIK